MRNRFIASVALSLVIPIAAHAADAYSVTIDDRTTTVCSRQSAGALMFRAAAAGQPIAATIAELPSDDLEARACRVAREERREWRAFKRRIALGLGSHPAER